MFCSNCGKSLADGAKFCPDCGTPVEAATGAPKDQPSVEPQQTSQADSWQERVEELNNDTPNGAEKGTYTYGAAGGAQYNTTGNASYKGSGTAGGFMPASEFRHIAREKMRGNYGIAILTMILYSILGSIIFLTGSMTYGLVNVFQMISDGQKPRVGDGFTGFDNFGKTLWLYIRQLIFVFLWTCLFVIPGIVKAYAYSMSFYILRDRPELTAAEAMNLSKELMQGYKWRLFCVQFSYIGWCILCNITWGILYLWIAPQMQMATVEFYNHYIRPRV